jgi:hypothetical protein
VAPDPGTDHVHVTAGDADSLRRPPKRRTVTTTQAVLDHHLAAIRGEHAYSVWHGDSETYRLTFGTDTFVVRGGKIVFRSFAGQIEPK